MEFFRPFTFLLESFTLLPKNPKLLFSISFLLLLLHSSISFLLLRTKLLLPNLQTTPTSLLHHLLHAQFPAPPSSSYLHRDLPLFLALHLCFAVAFSLISFLSTLSTILLASASYNSRILSLRTFLSESCRTCPRLLLTCLHVFSLTLGYFVLAAILTAPLLFYFDFNRLSVILTIAVLVVLFSYLFVPLVLSLPVAVVEEEEECYGLEAVGKAAMLIRGRMRVYGFVVNACFCGVVLGAIEICTRMERGRLVWEIGAANLVLVVKIFLEIVYTVVYFHCKRERGEEIELYGGLQYGKLPTIMALSDVEEEDDHEFL